MNGTAREVLVTGATGLVGGDVLERLLRGNARLHAHVILRDAARWPVLARRLGPLAARVTPHAGDITHPDLRLTAASRRAIAAAADLIIHCAADTRFSQALPHARRVNRDGTRHLLELAGECTGLDRFVHVSTAFVAGRRTGVIAAEPCDGSAGFVNAYERSKFEAERHVRESALPWLIVRPSTIVCDGRDGRVRQVNAVHRALLLCRAGLAALVPGDEATPVDLVTTDYVAGGVVRLSLDPGAGRRAWHLCAGAAAITLGEMLDRCWSHWRRDARWERRGVERPAFTTLAAWRLFESAVAETGDARLRAITRSLTHFVPQLALPKCFETAETDAELGYAAPSIADCWSAMLDDLARGRGRPLEAA